MRRVREAPWLATSPLERNGSVVTRDAAATKLSICA
jgi:hypothetical protein